MIPTRNILNKHILWIWQTSRTRSSGTTPSERPRLDGNADCVPSFPVDYIEAPRATTDSRHGADAPRRAPFPWGRPDKPAEGSARTSRPPKGPCYLLTLS